MPAAGQTTTPSASATTSTTSAGPATVASGENARIHGGRAPAPPAPSAASVLDNHPGSWVTLSILAGMGSCTACGDCCDPVWYPLGPADIRQSASTTAAEDLVFAAAHWTATGDVTADGMHAYECDRFDAESRLCTAHDERPPICRA